jgi:cytosine/adenosine deaminase-related metal-dependent hydrolase
MIITNGTVVTVDKGRRIIQNGAVLIEGDRIVAVGKTSELEDAFPDEERIDARGGIVMPGLIDCHIHLPQAMIRGCADGLRLKEWLADRVWVLQGLYSPDDAVTSSELCMLEMIKCGTTTFIDTLLATHYDVDRTADAVIRSGMRGMLAKSIMDTPGYADDEGSMVSTMQEDKETCFRVAEEMYEKWHGKEGRVFVWLGPRPAGGATPETYREVGEWARSHDTRVTWHFAEGDDSERNFIQETYGKSPTEFAEDLGLLWPGQVLGHAVWLDDRDVANLARTGAHVCHLPTSNMKLGFGFARVPDMIEAGVNVVLGTDGGPSDNMHDMFHAMNLAAMIHKGHRQDPALLPAETMIEMVTVNGAKAVGLGDEIGSLEEGKKADLIILTADSPHLTPSINPLSNLVYAATGREVRTVIIDGNLVMKDREVLTFDEDRILKEASERAAAVVERSGLNLNPEWPNV